MDAGLPPAGEARLADELGLEDPTDADGLGSTPPPGAGDGTTGRSRRWPALLAAALVVLIAVGGFLALRATQQPSGTSADGSGAGSTSAPASVHIQSSSVAYAQASLGTQARTLIGAPSATVGASQADLGPVATPAGLSACLAAIGENATGGVSVDLASYEGAPAAIIVVARADGSASAYAVGRQCAAGDPQILQDAVPVP